MTLAKLFLLVALVGVPLAVAAWVALYLAIGDRALLWLAWRSR